VFNVPHVRAACGVCSTAQDFGARYKGGLESAAIVCATSYVFSKDFDELLSCFSDLGFTQECSILWAHAGATNGAKCALQCLPDSETGLTLLNGDPPECEIQACLTCQGDFRVDFDAIAGLGSYNAGITERIARDCDLFYRVTHDPCVGIGGTSPTVPVAPVASPETQPPFEPTDTPKVEVPTDGSVAQPTDAPEVEPTDAPAVDVTDTPPPEAAPSSANSKNTCTSTSIPLRTLMASLWMLAYHF
jgi:hypothetical protein